MRARSPHEPHRAATPLELFFDLVFVVAIAQAGEGLHHAIVEGHTAAGVGHYLMVFFGIWWAWMNFTWFASAYDCDDVPYRVAVFVIVTGALIFAGGVKTMFEQGDVNVATVGGYVIMRLALVTQWLRAGASDPQRRVTTRRFAIGVSLCQLAWIGALLAPASWVIPAFVIFGAAELIVPIWAERAANTTWHPHHIAERYGLFTIIVLGESVLAATLAVQAALASGEQVLALAPVIGGGLLIVYSLWWLYFYLPVHDLLADHDLRRAVVWGYGHFIVFGSAAAVGAGLAVAVDQATQDTAIGSIASAMAVAIPVALYVISLGWLHYRPSTWGHASLGPVTVVLVLLAPFTRYGIPMIGLILATLVVFKIATRMGEATLAPESQRNVRASGSQ